jgi:hypothetical protein
MPSGLRNSSASISPGDTGLSFLLISISFRDRWRVPIRSCPMGLHHVTQSGVHLTHE